MTSPRIDVVLATFNGARFIAEQLASIAAQTYAHWRLLVRDDGSSDETVAELEAFAALHPGRIEWLRSVPGRLGVVGNFDALLKATDAPFVALCDQDDVWLPEKLERLVRQAQRREASRPLLVHSDVQLVDERLGVITPSLWRHGGFDRERGGGLRRVLLMQPAVGCSVLVNRALLELALPIPPDAVMHDWWLTLTAAAFGEVVAEPAATVLYRQHGANELGASRYRALRMLVQAALRPRGTMRATILKTQRQARAFAERHRDRLSAAQYSLVASYGNLSSMSRLARRAFLARSGIHYPGIARNLLLAALV